MSTSSVRIKRRSYDKLEMIRRFRVGQILRLIHDRYGPVLPDDDAGRDDLYWLLLYISPSPNAYLKIPRTIEELAPWMPAKEREELIDRVNLTPHLPTSKQLGMALNVTNAVRERLKLWHIRARDMTALQRLAWRKQKDRERKRRLREQRGARPQAASISRTKPWKLAGFKCRRTWERHGKTDYTTPWAAS